MPDVNPPVVATVVPSFDKKDIEDNKFLACLSYVSILFLIPLLAKKDSKFCQEHAKQGFVVFIAGIIGSFIFWFPVIGWLIGLVFFVLVLMAFVKCLMGEFWEVPVIGALRSKINL